MKIATLSLLLASAVLLLSFSCTDESANNSSGKSSPAAMASSSGNVVNPINNKSKSESIKNPTDVVDFFLATPFGYGNTYESKLDILTNIPLVIDITNAYLKCSNHVEWGYYIKECAVFTCADNTKIIAISETERNQDFNGIKYKHSFWSYKNGEFIDISDTAIPKFGYNDFLEEGTKVDPKMDEAIMFFNAHYILPQNGTTIRVVLDESPYYPNNDLGVKEKDYTKAYQSRKYKSVELNFDKVKGQFIVGNKEKR